MDYTKEFLRKKYKDIRKNIHSKKEKDRCIFNNVIKHKKINEAETILLYYSKEEEVDTVHLIEYFLSINKRVALPKTTLDTINFYYITSINDKKLGKYNIFEPISNEQVKDFSNSICLVPGICFDIRNYRVGYGGGYYDRFLSIYTGYSIGLTYQECLVDKIDIDSYDKSVDFLITDKKI